jgi:hypothetical protein
MQEIFFKHCKSKQITQSVRDEGSRQISANTACNRYNATYCSPSYIRNIDMHLGVMNGSA